jgi:co-chaperonin GroES (HSP10)
MTLYSIPAKHRTGGSGTANLTDIFRPYETPPEVVDHTGQWTPLGSRYLVYLMREDEEQVSAGGIVMVQPHRTDPSEAIVLAVGPGRLLDNGRRYPMQARVGDRVLLERYPDGGMRGFEALPFQAAGNEREGFVSDEDLCAIIPAPDYNRIEAAGDYVLVEPDRRPDLIEHPSGILQATYLLAGGEERETKNRGEQWDGFTVGSVSLPRRGKVIDYGPGPVCLSGDDMGYRVMSEGAMRRTMISRVGEIYYGRSWPGPGRMVHWSERYEAIRFSCAGEPRALIRASDLIAVEVED